MEVIVGKGTEGAKNTLPIDYTAVFESADGHSGSVDLEEPGWKLREDLRGMRTFTLQPKLVAKGSLPVVSVHLDSLPDGTRRELIYLSRVFGRLTVANKAEGESALLFRLYGVGWKAVVGGRKMAAVNWIYPGGSIVAQVGDDVESILPPYVDEYIEHLATIGKVGSIVAALAGSAA